jgi:YHS domain-containing protein
MNWLSQNWYWVLLAIGVAVYFLRGGLGRHAGGHGGHGRHGGGPGGLLGGGMGHGDGRAHGGGQSPHRDEEPRNSRAPSDAPEAVVDPVSGEAVRTGQPLTSLYAGKVYYFASSENRDRFEAMPKMTTRGQT